jgi:hypothetical protein
MKKHIFLIKDNLVNRETNKTTLMTFDSDKSNDQASEQTADP